MTTKTDEVTVYNWGLVALSACAPKEMPVEEVAKFVNASHPTGIESRWEKSNSPTFSGGEPNPSPCNTDPERLHWLFNC